MEEELKVTVELLLGSARDNYNYYYYLGFGASADH